MQNINDDVGESTRLKIWQQLLKLRLVEKKAYDLFLQNLIKGTSHLSLGQEAIGSAFGVVLEKKDYEKIITNDHIQHKNQKLYFNVY